MQAYINDENFGSLGSDLSMWEFFNLLTGACKTHSYIDSFLDRAVNATEIATGINAALHGDTKYKWFIDWLNRGIFRNGYSPILLTT